MLYKINILYFFSLSVVSVLISSQSGAMEFLGLPNDLHSPTLLFLENKKDKNNASLVCQKWKNIVDNQTTKITLADSCENIDWPTIYAKFRNLQEITYSWHFPSAEVFEIKREEAGLNRNLQGRIAYRGLTLYFRHEGPEKATLLDSIHEAKFGSKSLTAYYKIFDEEDAYGRRFYLDLDLSPQDYRGKTEDISNCFFSLDIRPDIEVTEHHSDTTYNVYKVQNNPTAVKLRIKRQLIPYEQK